MDQNDTIDTLDMLDFGPVEDKSRDIIKVIGVGGGGCNAVRNMYNERVEGVTFAVCNTDSKPLSRSPVPVKLQLGAEGLGAGGDPQKGRIEAQTTTEGIANLLKDGTKMVFVTACMGGGTGTGAAPVVASVCRQMGLLTVGVVTIPFYFEKKKKIVKALRGVEELRKNVDALLIINNERLSDIYADSDLSIKEAFAVADGVLKNAVQGIAELITLDSDGGIHSDFRDVETTLKNGGGAIMAMGRASGERRVERAILDALESPLLYGNDIGNAKRILFNIYASDEAPLKVREMQEIDDFFDLLDPNIEVIWGTATDDTLGTDAKVTILATGLEDELRSERTDDAAATDEYYEELIPKLYKPYKRPAKQPEAEAVPPAAEPTFVVEEAPAPEPAESEPVESAEESEPEPAEEPAPEPAEGMPGGGEAPASVIDKWKRWLKNKAEDMMREEV